MSEAAPSWLMGLWPAPVGRTLAPTTADARAIGFEAMTEADVDGVHAVEASAYAHPWSPRHFLDSLRAGHPAVLLLGDALPGERPFPARTDGRWILGYFVAMPGVDEVHLLNITVNPPHQRQGWARFMLDALVLWSRGQRAQSLWLEVRQSNAPARRLYGRYGFIERGLRRGYYPMGSLPREDAIVMQLDLQTPEAAA